jgi:hypothetical protein
MHNIFWFQVSDDEDKYEILDEIELWVGSCEGAEGDENT